MPAAWLVFVGLALPTKFTDNYLEFITPGILVMTTLFSSLQGGSLMIFDKILGFLNKFLAMPSPRESMLYGKILFISVRGLLQATVILLMATLLGVRVLNPINIVLIYLTLFLFSVFFSALSTMIGLYLSDHDSYAAVNSMISMPLFFTSSALMPYEVMPAWLRTMAKLNPVSYAIDSTRMLFEGDGPRVRNPWTRSRSRNHGSPRDISVPESSCVKNNGKKEKGKGKRKKEKGKNTPPDPRNTSLDPGKRI